MYYGYDIDAVYVRQMINIKRLTDKETQRIFTSSILQLKA